MQVFNISDIQIKIIKKFGTAESKDMYIKLKIPLTTQIF